MGRIHYFRALLYMGHKGCVYPAPGNMGRIHYFRALLYMDIKGVFIQLLAIWVSNKEGSKYQSRMTWLYQGSMLI